MSRKENFIRIAESRTNKIIDLIILLGNLSNKSYYDYTEDQVNSMFEAIENEIIVQKQKFFSMSKKPRKFKL